MVVAFHAATLATGRALPLTRTGLSPVGTRQLSWRTRGRHCHQHVKIGAVRRKGERYDGAPEFFVDGHQRNRGKVHTPKFFRYIKGQQTQFLTFCEERRGLFRAEGRVLAPDLTLDNPGFEWHQFPVHEPSDKVLQLAVFLAEFGGHSLASGRQGSRDGETRTKCPREPL